MVTITDRWGNEIINPDKTIADKTFNDVFLDKALPEISITDGDFHLDIKNNGWVYLENNESMFYMKELKIEKIRQLWEWFYEEQIDYIAAESWIEGVPLFNDDL